MTVVNCQTSKKKNQSQPFGPVKGHGHHSAWTPCPHEGWKTQFHGNDGSNLVAQCGRKHLGGAGAKPSPRNACGFITKTAQEQLEEFVRGLKAFKGPRLQTHQAASGYGLPWMSRFNTPGINRGLAQTKQAWSEASTSHTANLETVLVH